MNIDTYCHVGNTAQHCRLGLFQDSEFAGDFEDSKSNSAAIVFINVFRKSNIFPMSFSCKKRTSVSQTSAESEIMSPDAGLRMDGIPDLDLWDMVIEV